VDTKCRKSQAKLLPHLSVSFSCFGWSPEHHLSSSAECVLLLQYTLDLCNREGSQRYLIPFLFILVSLGVRYTRSCYKLEIVRNDPRLRFCSPGGSGQLPERFWRCLHLPLVSYIFRASRDAYSAFHSHAENQKKTEAVGPCLSGTPELVALQIRVSIEYLCTLCMYSRLLNSSVEPLVNLCFVGKQVHLRHQNGALDLLCHLRLLHTRSRGRHDTPKAAEATGLEYMQSVHRYSIDTRI